MPISTVGIVGYGSFGKLVHTLLNRFAPTVRVRVHSSRSEPDRQTFFSLEDVAACDAIVLAVPISAFEDTVQKILPMLGTNSVIVDVATVKVHTVHVLKRLAPDRKYIATHPMFGPESYKKLDGNVHGFRIVIAESTLPMPQKDELVSFLQSIGFDVVEVTADAHDKHLAETLFLTHFVGQIISKGNFNRTEIDTVSFGYLMDAVESVKHDSQLYQDVFKYNLYCKEVLERFETSEKEVQALLAK